MMRTLLLFGSFNPPHLGHMALAEELLARGVGEQLWFVVSPQNPFKQPSELAAEHHRFEMVRLAVAESRFRERMQACDVEFSMGRPSYTIDTLDELSARYGEREFVLVIGSDNVDALDKWRDYQRLLSQYPIVVYPRNGYQPKCFLDRVEMLSEMPTFDSASTDIRAAIGCGQQEVPVCKSVNDYIKEMGLWS